jgi:hypothetical protein
MSKSEDFKTQDFSLVAGGMLFRLLRRSHLTGDALELFLQRILVSLLITWLPLLVLSVLEGEALGGSAVVPFLLDWETQVRFLVVLPLFFIAELVNHWGMRLVAKQFHDRNLIPESALPRFDLALSSVLRLRNSVFAEVLVIGLVYAVGINLLWRQQTALQITMWYGASSAGGLKLTLAGMWFLFVSLPLYQFLQVRWYFRVFIWIRFLWQVSRIDLRLVPTHPDRAGGLGFLSNTAHYFMPLVAAPALCYPAGSPIASSTWAPHCLISRLRSPSSWSLCRFWYSSRSCFLRPSLLGRSGQAVANTVRWPSIMCKSSIPNGCAALRRPMSRWWGAPTFNPSPIYRIATRWCRQCASLLLRGTPLSALRP